MRRQDEDFEEEEESASASRAVLGTPLKRQAYEFNEQEKTIRRSYFGCLGCCDERVNDPSPWLMNCPSPSCSQRSSRLRAMLSDSALYPSFTLILMPQIPIYINETTINSTLYEWRNNHRCIFIDGSGRPYTPTAGSRCLFAPPTASYSTAAASVGESQGQTRSNTENPARDRVQFFAVSEQSSFSNIFRGPARHLSFLRHLLLLEDVKSSCKAMRNSEKFLQCRESDALVFDNATLLKVRQLNPIDLASSTSTSASSSTAATHSSAPSFDDIPPCPCGCVTPFAVCIHTFNIPTRTEVRSKSSFSHYTRCRASSLKVSVSGVMPRVGRGRPAAVTDFTDLRNVPATVIEVFFHRDCAPMTPSSASLILPPNIVNSPSSPVSMSGFVAPFGPAPQIMGNSPSSPSSPSLSSSSEKELLPFFSSDDFFKAFSVPLSSSYVSSLTSLPVSASSASSHSSGAPSVPPAWEAGSYCSKSSRVAQLLLHRQKESQFPQQSCPAACSFGLSLSSSSMSACPTGLSVLFPSAAGAFYPAGAMMIPSNMQDVTQLCTLSPPSTPPPSPISPFLASDSSGSSFRTPSASSSLVPAEKEDSPHPDPPFELPIPSLPPVDKDQLSSCSTNPASLPLPLDPVLPLPPLNSSISSSMIALDPTMELTALPTPSMSAPPPFASTASAFSSLPDASFSSSACMAPAPPPASMMSSFCSMPVFPWGSYFTSVSYPLFDLGMEPHPFPSQLPQFFV